MEKRGTDVRLQALIIGYNVPHSRGSDRKGHQFKENVLCANEDDYQYELQTDMGVL